MGTDPGEALRSRASIFMLPSVAVLEHIAKSALDQIHEDDDEESSFLEDEEEEDRRPPLPEMPRVTFKTNAKSGHSVMLFCSALF